MSAGQDHVAQYQNPSQTAGAPLERDSAARRAWRNLTRQRLAMLGLGLIGLELCIALFATWLAPYDPTLQDLSVVLQKPSAAHLLGTDDLGRDVFSRLIYGYRYAFIAIFIGVGTAMSLGVPLGLWVGYVGGRIERGVMWGVNLLVALPGLIVLIAVLTFLPPGLAIAMCAVGALLATQYVRLTRAAVLAERKEVYVDSARVLGFSAPHIVIREILPNILPPLIVLTAILMGVVNVLEAELSFLGLGIPLDTPSWGRMLATARGLLVRQPYLVFPPGIALVLNVIAFNWIADGVRAALGRGQTAPTLSRVLAATNLGMRAERENIGARTTTGLCVRGLGVTMPQSDGAALVLVSDIALEVRPGETLGLVGESASGKSITAQAILGMVPPPGYVSAGSIQLDGRELLGGSPEEWSRVRGHGIALISQEPQAALNPTLTIGQQLVQVIQRHQGLDKRAATQQAFELLDMVKIPEGRARFGQYPHQFSGGMAQRVVLARALACRPRVLIADEPTSAVDVTIQGQILDLLGALQKEFGMALLLITHDMGVVAELCDRVTVMYAGQVVESAPVADLFHKPQHPYTLALLRAMPLMEKRNGKLFAIEGSVPSPLHYPQGCRFHPRCALAQEECRYAPIEMRVVGINHCSRCIRIEALNAEVPA
jgi:peptide/nickel transport system permease protein